MTLQEAKELASTLCATPHGLVGRCPECVRIQRRLMVLEGEALEKYISKKINQGVNGEGEDVQGKIR